MNMIYFVFRNEDPNFYPKNELFLRFDERSSDSYIGDDDLFYFFFRKSLKIRSRSIALFCGLTFDLFKV